MIRNNFFRRIIVVTLTAALLLFMGGRAIPVSALADPIVSDVAPVFDTQIYQLQDYIDHGGMTDPQLEIFYVLAGLYAVAQSGVQNYKLHDPFEYESGVWNWFKSMGIRMYNSVVSLLPDTAQMPITGQVYSTIPFKKAASLYVATLMGMAQKAQTYDTVEEFQEEVAEGSVYLPWNLDIQKGMNSIFGIYGGIYSWQFDSNPWEYTEEYNGHYMTDAQQAVYDTVYGTAQQPVVRANYYGGSEVIIYSYDGGNNAQVINNLFSDYHILFIDSSENKLYLCKDNGTKLITNYNRIFVKSTMFTDGRLESGNSFPIITMDYDGNFYFTNVPFTFSDYGTYAAVARAYFDNDFSVDYQQFFFQDFIDHVYVGTNWLNKQEIYNVEDLNFDEPDISNDIDNYVTVPDYTEYFIDIHDLVNDLLDTTDLINVILNHIVDINGVPVHDTDLIRVTTSIYNLLRETEPVLPVDLNDIAEYTDNTYLDVVKERARRSGNELAALVAFWHNCDPEIIYVLFGAGITVLVGAFIGKWGHS